MSLPARAEGIGKTDRARSDPASAGAARGGPGRGAVIVVRAHLDQKGRNYNDQMVVFRYAFALALACWLGGMVVLGAIVAPSTFGVLQARQPTTGRMLAGAVFGETLRRFHLVSYAAGAVLLGSLAGMALTGARPAAFGARLAIAAVMLVLALVSGTVVSRRIERVQQQIQGPVASLSADDPRRVEFGRLHAMSTGLMLVNIAGGLVLLYWQARQ